MRKKRPYRRRDTLTPEDQPRSIDGTARRRAPPAATRKPKPLPNQKELPWSEFTPPPSP